MPAILRTVCRAPYWSIVQRTRLDFGHPNRGVDELSHQCTSECANRVLGRTINATSSIRLPSSNGADVNNMACLPCLEI